MVNEELLTKPCPPGPKTLHPQVNFRGLWTNQSQFTPEGITKTIMVKQETLHIKEYRRSGREHRSQRTVTDFW